MRPLPQKARFRPREAAEILGISVRTVYVLVERGELKAIRPSPHTTQILRESLEELLKIWDPLL